MEIEMNVHETELDIPDDILMIQDDAKRAEAICDLAVTESGIEKGAYLIAMGIELMESLGGGADDDMYYQTCVAYLATLRKGVN